MYVFFVCVLMLASDRERYYDSIKKTIKCRYHCLTRSSVSESISFVTLENRKSLDFSLLPFCI